jgi:hypothetical protein
MLSMDQIGEIILRLKITELEAQLALREIMRVGLNQQIDDPETEGGERYLAALRRDRTIIEWGELMTELQEFRERQTRELELAPHADLN